MAQFGTEINILKSGTKRPASFLVVILRNQSELLSSCIVTAFQVTIYTRARVELGPVYISRMLSISRQSATVYFVGACPVCPREIEMYRRQPGADAIQWVDVAHCEAPRRADGNGYVAAWHCGDELADCMAASLEDRRLNPRWWQRRLMRRPKRNAHPPTGHRFAGPDPQSISSVCSTGSRCGQPFRRCGTKSLAPHLVQ